MALNDLVAKGAALSDLRAFRMAHNDFVAMWVMFSDLRGCMLIDFAGSRANEAHCSQTKYHDLGIKCIALHILYPFCFVGRGKPRTRSIDGVLSSA